MYGSCKMMRSNLVLVIIALVVGLSYGNPIEEIETDLARDTRSYDTGTGLQFLGIGYDIINACPDGYIDFGGSGGSAGQDPGLLTTKKMIRWHGEKEQNHALVPEEVTFGGFRDNCATTASTRMLFGAKSYQEELSKSVEAGVEVSFGPVTAGFSKSNGVSTANENMNSKNQIFFRESRICNLGKIEYNENLANYYQHELTDIFIADVCALPTGDFSGTNKGKYMEFIKKWGTHMTTAVQFGYKELTLRKQTETEIFSRVGEGSSSGFTVSGGFGPVSASVSVNTEKYSETSQQNNEMGDVTATLEQGTAANPEPTKLSLKSISGLFDDKFWQSSTCLVTGRVPNLAILRTNMDAALRAYASWIQAPTLSNIPMTFKVEWPAGNYALLAVEDGYCPFSDGFTWQKGSTLYKLDDSPGTQSMLSLALATAALVAHIHGRPKPERDHVFSTPSMLVGSSGWYKSSSLGILSAELTKGMMKTCSKITSTVTASQLNWEKGQYCIMAMKNGGNSCPTGFGLSWTRISPVVEIFGSTPVAKSNGIKVVREGVAPEVYKSDRKSPSTTYDNIYDSYENVGMNLCCRNDGFANNAILLPSNKPFTLFPVANICQSVVGMIAEKVRVETIGRVSLDVGPRDAPKILSTGQSPGAFYVCKYTLQGTSLSIG